jgi:molybdate/tungstate transport system substrate-binding protein
MREITGDPNDPRWYEMLAKNDRVLVGRSDPDTDPAGCRTLLLWKLADAYYAEPVHDALLARFPRPGVDTEAVLSAQLEVGDLDYIFTYRSLALDHGHRYVDLPDEIDLSNASFEAMYGAFDAFCDGESVAGTTILYGFTIPTNAPHPDLALEFAALVASEWGMARFAEAGLLAPPPGHDKPFVPADQAGSLPRDLEKRVEADA